MTVRFSNAIVTKIIHGNGLQLVKMKNTSI